MTTLAPQSTTDRTLLVENAELRARLAAAEETLHAIRGGEVDALVIEGAEGPRVYILQGLDAAMSRFRGDILAQVSDAVIAIDGDQRVTYVNAAAERLYGMTVSEALGQNVSMFYETRWLRPDDEAAAATALRERGEWRGENLHIKRSGEEIWVESSLSRFDMTNGMLRGTLAVIRDITARKRSEDHVKLLMAEVNHRAKNLLSVVQAITRHTAKHGDPATFVTRLLKRINGLSTCHDLLVQNQWQGADVLDLVESQLAHFRDLIGVRVLFSGPPVLLKPAAAQAIGMALHELATNAAKYGALSNNYGQVRISWQVADATFSMSWIEDGGPKVTTPLSIGFGQLVIGRMAEAAVQGKADIRFLTSGLAWKLSAPVENALVSREGSVEDDAK